MGISVSEASLFSDPSGVSLCDENLDEVSAVNQPAILELSDVSENIVLAEQNSKDEGLKEDAILKGAMNATER